jgi:hypothetical protein
MIPVAGVLTLGVLLGACSKFDDDDNGSNTPVSALMSFNLVPDKAGIGIALSGNLLTNSALSYTNFTGTYQQIYPGNREIESFDADTDSTLAKNSFSFEPDKYYSLFVTGANGSYANIVTRDNFDSLGNTSGKVRPGCVISMPFRIPRNPPLRSRPMATKLSMHRLATRRYLNSRLLIRAMCRSL